jgi:hypothetical protein
MADSKLADETIDEHARAIGYLCIYWAALEHGMDRLLEILAPLEPGDISNSITSEIDGRTKLTLLRKVGFARQPSKGWYGSLEGLINRIDNILRLERNRYIHGLWIGRSPIIRRSRAHKAIKRPQSRQQRKLTAYDKKPIEPKDIWETVESISRAQIHLNALEASYRGHASSLAKRG